MDRGGSCPGLENLPPSTDEEKRSRLSRPGCHFCSDPIQRANPSQILLTGFSNFWRWLIAWGTQLVHNRTVQIFGWISKSFAITSESFSGFESSRLAEEERKSGSRC